MICTCKDWKENIDILNGPIVLDQLRRGVSDFKMKLITYCPWCGRYLIKDVPRPDTNPKDPRGSFAPPYCKPGDHIIVHSTFGKVCQSCGVKEDDLL